MTDHFAELIRQITIIKDRVRGVFHGHSNGLYLYGRPGISKSHMVRSTLDLLAVNYTPNSGHLTPIGLFDLLLENHDRIIVLDDVSAILNQPIALQLLLSSLGNPHDGSNIRYVNYKTAKGPRTAPFSGGIIFMSNLGLEGHHQEILAALRDRVNVIHFDPTDDQISAMILKLADDGIGGTKPSDARMVATFLLDQCKHRSIRPSVRLFVDKAIKDFQLWLSGKCAAHWRDLIISNLEQSLVKLQNDPRDLSRAEQIEAERRITLDIFLSFPSRAERVAEWEARTGKKQAAFYRRLTELRQDGRLPEPDEKNSAVL